MDKTIQFKLRASTKGAGRSAGLTGPAGLPLPRVFETRLVDTLQRSANTSDAAKNNDDDEFLPSGLLRVDAALELSPTARSSTTGQAEQTLSAAENQVMVLELPDGVTVITHPANLHAVLGRINPAAIDQDGVLALDKALRERAAAADPASASRGLVSDVFSGIYQLTVGTDNDPIIEAAKRKACEWIGEKAEEKIAQYADLGVSWAGTKALMWAIESRLKAEPGLYRWSGRELGERLASPNAQLEADAKGGPLLVFIHGTGSSTQGSFDNLKADSASYWRGFEERYGNRVLALEHRSLSESPIDNALQLVRALPIGAKLHLVTHSRGGLVGDLLCLDGFEGLIDGYALDAAGLGEADPVERARITTELLKAHAEQRAALRDLAAELVRKKLRIERYVRVASPSRGTRLASGNFDVFLSGLLSLMGWIPVLKGNLVYSAFKRVVLEVARNRTKPNLVPGIEAMLPGSPLSKFLARATPQADIKLAVMTGDIEGGGWLKKLAVMFTDFTFFDNFDNDLVVDTDAMSAGIARPDNAQVLFDQGPLVSHFRYFTNDLTRTALQRCLLNPGTEQIEHFLPLRALDTKALALGTATQATASARGAGGDLGNIATQPVVILLPGIMGSHLWLNRSERVWLSVPELLTGGLTKLAYRGDVDDVSAEAVIAANYGELCEHLQTSHRVVAHAYDWRLPINELADQLAAVLRSQLDATAAKGASSAQPLRILAHSMGGLLVRALVHSHRLLWDELMQRPGARLVMLGTPHQGSYSTVETLLGKGDNIRKLGVLDLRHSLQDVLDIVAGFPGALQLLPKKGFNETVEIQDKASVVFDFFKPDVWRDLKAEMCDFWFGDQVGGLPSAEVLTQANWLWNQDTEQTPSLPAAYAKQVTYVFGCAAKTACGIVKQGNAWKMLGTSHGDGTVTWDSGRIGGIGQFFYMPAEHGELLATPEYFAAMTELLEDGKGGNLLTSPPAVRDSAPDDGKASVASYEAGPVLYPSDLELAGGLFGSSVRTRVRAPAQPGETLQLRVRAMDLRRVTQPILVGHYEQDTISGAEALIDRELVNGELTIRNHLGLYAGAVGTASAVLLNATDQDRERGCYRGAVVAGLGLYDGSLTVGKLTDAVRTACLRYLITVLDSSAMARQDETTTGIGLASLLLGYNSSANLSIGDSVQAVVRGVMDANLQFALSTHSMLRVTTLEFVEIYIDSAITATYATQDVANAINADQRGGCKLSADPSLHEGEGMRHRLLDGRGGGYWPRLMITDADRPAEGSQSGATVTDSKLPAQNLRYLYLGQRARAESVVQQRQPGLVEQLVASQVGQAQYDADFSRTLFQLLIPFDFKDAARQMQQMVFVLDNSTANFPWELMLADNQPLATRTAMVRQLATNQFRRRVNQTQALRAYVVGNPSTDGFGAAFPAPPGSGRVSPPALQSLDAAEREADEVCAVLTERDYEVKRVVGQEHRAIDVINGLFLQPYRIVHIAGHGVFEERAADGRTRSGVVLSDGLLITAAEIDAMEVVPDLVFINCCHLGQIEGQTAGQTESQKARPVAFNKLAYSIARQLVDMGVRAVVVAGWAVQDADAALFAQCFYQALVHDNLSFGEAVFKARQATWKRYPKNLTWGAYQAYGDPSWKLDPRTVATQSESKQRNLVAPEELIEKLVAMRLDLQRRKKRMTAEQAQASVAEVKPWFDNLPSEWTERADLQCAVGEFFADLGPTYAAWAKLYFERTVLAADRAGRAPLKAIDDLVQSESRLAEVNGNVEMAARAIGRMKQLVGLSGASLAPVELAGALALNLRRAGRLASAYKRKAAIHARAYLRGNQNAFVEMSNALDLSAEAYQTHAAALIDAEPESRPDTKLFAYPTLNYLFLWSLTASAEAASAQIALAQRCIASANRAFREDSEVWNATMVPDAHLLISVLDGSLKQTSPAVDGALAVLAQRYDECFESALINPRQRDAVVNQIKLMALFHQAHEAQQKASMPPPSGVAEGSVAEGLKALVMRLSPEQTEPKVPPASRPSSAKQAAAVPRRQRKATKK